MVKNPLANARDIRAFAPWFGECPRRREWQPPPVFLPGEFHRQRSLAGLQSMELQRLIAVSEIKGHSAGRGNQDRAEWGS